MDISTNTNDYPPLRPWLTGVVSSMAALSALFVGLRLTSRRLLQQKLWWDDRLIIMSMACNLLAVGLIFAMYSQGLGLPAPAVAPAQIVNMTKIALAARIVFVWNLCLVKLSLLFLYYRIFDLSRLGRACLVATGAFVVLWTVLSTGLFIFTCAPIQKLWYPSLTGHCIDLVGRWIANAVSTVVADLLIILLPAPHVARMTLTRMEKLALTLVFAQGFFVVFASVYRFVLLLSSFSPSNPTYTLAPPMSWSEIEIAASIIGACLPVLHPLVSKITAATTTTSSSSSNTKETSFFSGSSWSGGSGSGSAWGRHHRQRPRGQKLSADSGRQSFMTARHQCASAADAWDWSRCVEGQTRLEELAKNEHQATASRGRDSELVEIPLHGISVTKDFRRYSVIDCSKY